MFTSPNKSLLFFVALRGIMPRIGEDGFQIVVKLSACQISGIRGEGFGKLHIKVLLTQGYPGEKMRFSMLVFSVNRGIHADVIVYIFAHLHTTLRTEENLLGVY